MMVRIIAWLRKYEGELLIAAMAVGLIICLLSAIFNLWIPFLTQGSY